jgi:hypothetical protein
VVTLGLGENDEDQLPPVLARAAFDEPLNLLPGCPPRSSWTPYTHGGGMYFVVESQSRGSLHCHLICYNEFFMSRAAEYLSISDEEPTASSRRARL